MVIDFHTHTFPDKIAAAAVDKLKTKANIVAYSDGTAGGLEESMKKADIDISVVMPVATNPEKVQHINDISAELTKKNGFIYFGCIHPDTDNAENEVRRIARLGLKGIKIHPVYQDVDIDDIRYLRILDAAAAEGLIVLMHAGDDIGFPGVVRCSPEMTRRAVDKIGKLKLVAAHMGGWQNWDRVAEYLLDTAVYIDTAFSLGAAEYLDKVKADATHKKLMDADEFCALVQVFGADRVLFGTDSPWADQKTALSQFNATALTIDEKQKILCDNARALLGI